MDANSLMRLKRVAGKQTVIVEARRQMHAPVASVIPIGVTLAVFDRPTPTLDRYDDLLEAR